MSIRKTSAEMLNDSFDRANNQPINSYEYSENLYYVYNSQTNGEYMVTVDHETQMVTDCTCPHRQYRLSALNLPCKHIIVVARQLGYNC